MCQNSHHFCHGCGDQNSGYSFDSSVQSSTSNQASSFPFPNVIPASAASELNPLLIQNNNQELDSATFPKTFLSTLLDSSSLLTPATGSFIENDPNTQLTAPSSLSSSHSSPSPSTGGLSKLVNRLNTRLNGWMNKWSRSSKY